MQLPELWTIQLRIVSIIFAAFNAVPSGSPVGRSPLALLNASRTLNERAVTAVAKLIIVLLENLFMTHVLQERGLSFEMERVSPQRIQMWAWMAGHSCSSTELELASTAFTALWYEAFAFDQYEELVREPMDVKWVVISLDFLVILLGTGANCWVKAVEMFTGHSKSPHAQLRHLEQDAREQFHLLKGLQQQAAECVMGLCSAYGWDIPKETSSYLADQQ